MIFVYESTASITVFTRLRQAQPAELSTLRIVFKLHLIFNSHQHFGFPNNLLQNFFPTKTVRSFRLSDANAC